MNTKKPFWLGWLSIENESGNHYSVYVVELSKEVLQEPKFKRHNPNYISGKPCVYIGMTGLEPELRFTKHKAGIKHNTYVLKYGIRLLPALYEKYNPMFFGEAETKEKKLAEELRKLGYGVWQA